MEAHILTDDGSPTLWSRRYREHYHSLSGASLEARERYVSPCRVVEIARSKGAVRILDIGFGLGWNVAWAFHEVSEMVAGATVEIVSLERDPLPLWELEKLWAHLPHPDLSRILTNALKDGGIRDSGRSLDLRFGAAEVTIDGVEDGFDCVFHDPFSPPRNGELWTPRFLSAVRERVVRGGILSTYSSAMVARRSLLESGWRVGQGPGVGRKSSGTLASAGAACPPLPPLPAREQRRLRRKLLEEREESTA